MASPTQMHNVLCRSVSIEARFTAVARIGIGPISTRAVTAESEECCERRYRMWLQLNMFFSCACCRSEDTNDQFALTFFIFENVAALTRPWGIARKCQVIIRRCQSTSCDGEPDDTRFLRDNTENMAQSNYFIIFWLSVKRVNWWLWKRHLLRELNVCISVIRISCVSFPIICTSYRCLHRQNCPLKIL
jgi:hypothetical protein